jgi:hypothetical protein
MGGTLTDWRKAQAAEWMSSDALNRKQELV